MHFGYGWPRIIGSEALRQQGECIFAWLDESYLLLVTESSVELWTGGQHRVKLGYAQLLADQSGVRQVAACWCPQRASLAILVRTQPAALM